MSVLNLGNIWQPLTNITMDGDTKGVLVQVGHILTIIFNSIMCSFTDALNVLVIMAVKRRSRPTELQQHIARLPGGSG